MSSRSSISHDTARVESVCEYYIHAQLTFTLLGMTSRNTATRWRHATSTPSRCIDPVAPRADWPARRWRCARDVTPPQRAFSGVTSQCKARRKCIDLERGEEIQTEREDLWTGFRMGQTRTCFPAGENYLGLGRPWFSQGSRLGF